MLHRDIYVDFMVGNRQFGQPNQQLVLNGPNAFVAFSAEDWQHLAEGERDRGDVVVTVKYVVDQEI